MKEKIIYVVGNSRSGTTLMANILGKNVQIFKFRELHFFEDAWDGKSFDELSEKALCSIAEKMLSIQEDGYVHSSVEDWHRQLATQIVSKLESRTAVEVYKAVIQHVTAKAGRAYALEQTPRYVFYIPEIWGLYPDAHIINMVRDPRAILLSQKFKWRSFKEKGIKAFLERVRLWGNYHPILTSKLWRAAISKGLEYSQSQNFYTVRYEDLVQEPVKTIQAVCEFLGVQYEDGMLDVERAGSSVKTTSTKEMGISGKSVKVWEGKLSPIDVWWCERINRDLMDKLGYSLSRPSVNLVGLGLVVLLLPIKLGLALILNMRRYTNLLSAIRRRI